MEKNQASYLYTIPESVTPKRSITFHRKHNNRISRAPEDYPQERGPQGDATLSYNYVRAVRGDISELLDGDSHPVTSLEWLTPYVGFAILVAGAVTAVVYPKRKKKTR